MNFSITHEEIKTSLNQQKNKNNTSVMGYIYVAKKFSFFCAIYEFIIIISFTTFVQDVFSNNHIGLLYIANYFPWYCFAYLLAGLKIFCQYYMWYIQ